MLFRSGIRYFIAFLGFFPFYGRILKFSKEQLKISFIASLLAWLSFSIQTFGIKLTSPTKSGFITGLNVIMVPIFAALLFRQKIQWKIWLSAILALVGVSILTFGEFGKLELGDLLIFICDIFYALFIIYLEYNLKKVDTIGFSVLLVLNMSVFSFLLSIFTDDYIYILNEGWFKIATWENFLYLIYMGIIASTIATLTQNFGQSVVKSTRAAIISALEPIFAAFFAIIFGKDKFSFTIFLGGFLVMIGIYISIFATPNQKIGKNRKSEEILTADE